MTRARITNVGLTRGDAAAHLRAARDARGDDRMEKIDWAFATIGDSPAAVRLKVDAMIEHDDDSVDAVLARALLVRPTDAGLCQRHALRLWQKGQFDAADREIDFVLEKRPHHGGALRLAGRIAASRGDWGRAARRLEQALRRRTFDDGLRRELINAQLAAGDVTRARAELARLDADDALLTSRVLRASDRWLEAETVLTSHLHGSLSHAERDVALASLVEVQERVATSTTLVATMSQITPDQPHATVAAGLAELGLGTFRRAVARMLHQIRQGTGADARTWMIVLIGATSMGRQRLASRALHHLRTGPVTVGPAWTAAAWRRALGGQIVCEHRDARDAGADPGSSRLAPLLADAVAVFDRVLAGGTEPLSAAERADLEARRSVCTGLLGRPGGRPATGDRARAA